MENSDQALTKIMIKFVIGTASLSHASTWESMSEKLESAFDNFGHDSELLNTQEVADALRYYLPQIKEMMRMTYNPDKDKMLSNLTVALTAA